MVMANGQPIRGLRFFRQGELTLLLRPPGEDMVTFPELSEEDLQPLRGALDGAALRQRRQTQFRTDDPLHPTPFASRLGRRTVIPLQWGGRETLVLQTVNLAAWDPRLDEPPADDAAHDLTALALADVGTAVNHLNDPRTTVGRIGAYQLVAASPNWLGMPFPNGI